MRTNVDKDLVKDSTNNRERVLDGHRVYLIKFTLFVDGWVAQSFLIIILYYFSSLYFIYLDFWITGFYWNVETVETYNEVVGVVQRELLL